MVPIQFIEDDMKKYEKYVPLEITNDCFDNIVHGLEEKILSEFWPGLPDGPQKDKILERIRQNIGSALGIEA